MVWLISADDTSCSKIQKEFDRCGSPYLVRHASKITQVPPEHINSTGVAFFIDSFHSEHLGFSGLKLLREKNFKGLVYMFGEPAPEKATNAFTDLQLSGFFPSIERADLAYVTGLVHHSFELQTDVNLNLLLNTEHKLGSAKITKLDDLDEISKKLSLFASRFGVEEDSIKKAVMGLCMSHIQTKHGESQIHEPFELKFGTDRLKIVLQVPTHSKGNKIDVLRNEFAQALSNFHNSELKNSVLFQEYHHLVKAVNNLSVIGGGSSSELEYPDPLFLITRIQFQTKSKESGQLGYYFSIQQTRPNDSLDERVAKLPLIEEAKETKIDTSTQDTPNVRSHSEKDLQEILSEPVIVGDLPADKGEDIALNAESSQIGKDVKDTKISEDETIVNKHYYEKLKQDLKDIRLANETMSEDVFRLMKERKEPALDTELKKQNEDLKSKIQKMETEFDAALKSLQTQIDELKEKNNENKTDKKDPKKAA